MRILAIRGKNLASLRGDFEVALNKPPLEQAGLFAITGHTGAGKSTLLDAMCLALFDKIPRLTGAANVKVGRTDEDEKQRISSNDVASIVSRGTAGAYAEVDFIGLDKQTYQAHWEIKRARNKLSGRLQKQSVTLKNLDNNETLGQNKSDTLDVISELIGLTFEQFRRSVLLAQGDFAAFLKAKSDERSSLLERITGTEIYSQLSISAYRNFQEQEQLLNRIQDKIKYDVPLENHDRQDLQIKISELSDELAVFKKNIENSHAILKWYEVKDQLQKEQTSVVQTLSELKYEKIEKDPLSRKLEKIVSIQSLRSLLQRLDELSEKSSDLEKQLKQATDESKTAKTNEDKLNASVNQIQDELRNSEQQYQTIKPALLKARELDTQLKLITQEYLEHEKMAHELSHSLTEIECQKINLDEVINEQKIHEQAISNISEELIELQKQRHKISLEELNQEKERLEQQRSKLQTLHQICQSYIETEVNIKQCQRKQAEQKKNLTELIEKVDIKNSEHQISFALLEEAKRARLIMQESVTQGAKSLRSLLTDEQACPVCGSIEHPWAEQDLMLNKQYHQQEERVNVLEKSVQNSLIYINNLQQKIEHEKSEQLQNNEQYQQSIFELDQLHNQWKKVIDTLDQVSISENENLQNIANNLLEKQSEKLLLSEIEKLNTQIELIKEQEKQTIHLQKKIDQKQIEKDQLQSKEKQLSMVIAEQRVVLNTINNLQQQQEKNQQALNKRQEQQAKLQDKRRQVFSEQRLSFTKTMDKTESEIMDADAIEVFFTQVISQLSTQYESEKYLLEQIKQKQIKVTEQCLYLQETIEQNKQQKQATEVQLNLKLDLFSLKLAELKSLLQYDEGWIKNQQADFSRLNNNLLKSETLLLERNSKLAQHETQFEMFPEAEKQLSRDDLREQVKEQLKLQQILQNTQQEKQLELKQDDEKKQRIANIREELDAQQQKCTEWGALNDLIGSASGHKFRIFAQSLTLESLLAHANEHLNDFARRYQLQRVPGTDLDLQIMDRDMADEVRSVQSLSGGESFLVSLALALGLASLSSTKTQVESLFIDEGFGTLDQETLDIAIASLDTLQGLGRKVGIISHVPILVERIGARVVVEKMGGGQSRVFIGT